jgi:predicted Rossmann fold flavoprotein
MEDVIIVGGGASGLMAAIMAAREGYKVTILEHKDKLGKKILATGNGKCNYTNLVQEEECYRSEDSSFPFQILSCFDVNKTIEFFLNLGIYPKDKKGYLYPYSEQATSVLNVLEMEIKRLKIKVCLSAHVDKIHKKKSKFLIESNNGKYEADKIILATGGCASSNLGSDGSGYGLAKAFGHNIIKPLPALVQLVSDEKYFKTLAGVRCNAFVQLFGNKKLLGEETGEILMANYGVSGIPILQLSRYAARALDRKDKVHLLIDYLPELCRNETKDLLNQRINMNGHKNIEEMLVGLFNNKLAYVLLLQSNIPVSKSCSQINDKDIDAITNLIKSFSIPISKTQSFEQAQVSSGGVDTREINPKTLESTLVKGLYFTGELIDVDGTCGGYNLQWAWSSGVVAARGLKG